MKKLIPLVLFAGVCFAQTEYTVKPIVSTTTIASCVLQVGEDTISATAKPFGTVAVGQYVYGPGIPFGTKVSQLINAALDSAIRIDKAITASGTVSLQFGYFTSLAYSSGDWVGFPFKVFGVPATQGGTVTLLSAEITDAADQIGATDIVFFSTGSGSQGLDNVAVAVPAADEAGVLGIVSLTTVTDLGAVKILTKDDINLALPIVGGGTLWARLIARSTPTLTAVDNYNVRLRFR